MKIAYNPLSFLGTVHIAYFNDSHGKTENFPKYKTATDLFMQEHKDEAYFNLSGGDINVDESPYNTVITKFFNKFLDAVATGNHDLEGGDSFARSIKEVKPKFKWLGANLKFTKNTPLKDEIQPSTVIERNGEKIGVIGIAPFDYEDVALINSHNDYIKVEPLDKTVKKVRQEVKKLEDQGINQIVLLAHTGQESPEGEQYYEEFAKIKGVDIIIGGHDHKQTDRWYKTEAGEPVKVVATGRTPDKPFKGNLDSFGILKAEFDDNGVLIENKTENTFKTTEFYPISYMGNALEIKGRKNEFVASLESPRIGKRTGLEENPTASLVCDAMLWYANEASGSDTDKADFALTNPASVRENFKSTEVMTNDLENILPFSLVQVLKTKLTKKQIMDTLSLGAKSTGFERVSPGLIQVSGLRYEVDEDRNVKNVCITDEQGNVLKRLDDMPDDAEFTVVYDTFLLKGSDGLTCLKKGEKEPVEIFDCSKREALYKYLKHKKHIHNTPYKRILTPKQMQDD